MKKHIHNFFIILSFGFVLIHCNSNKSISQMNTQKISYVDGNGNRYSLIGNKLTYDPVQPINSSSGTYSGGDPASIELNEEQIEQLLKTISEARENKADHTEKRTMGSATIFIYVEDEPHRFMLKMRSVSKKNIEKILKELISKNSPEN